MRERWNKYMLVLAVVFLFVSTAQCGLEDDGIVPGQPVEVTYDSRSLMINGKRLFMFSGSVHYPRLPPEMWGEVLDKCKEGGLNNIQTYIFWNLHETVQGQYNWTGWNDAVKFIKMCAERGMWVTLRVGPFIQAEFNHGGLPFWLREVPKITYRTDNPAYMEQMEKWFKVVIERMKENKLFAPQGGPIILSQVENEYDHVKEAFEGAKRYIHWAANMAIGLGTGVPWIMCKQKDAPDTVIDTCNGRHCGETFTGPHTPGKPLLWTENWTAQYRAFGDAPSQRAAEDIAYAVARWFSKNGSHTNYYMYYGGTNYGRTSAHFVTTRYYDEAPIDEFGMLREPKWGHLKDLHYVLRICKRTMLEGKYFVEVKSSDLEVRGWEKGNACVAFLWNNHTHEAKTINFRGQNYVIPDKSVTILPDCKTVMYNTDHLVSQHSSRTFVTDEKAQKSLKWEKTHERIPTKSDFYSNDPKEQFSVTKDTTDYLWYQTSVELDNLDLPFRKSLRPVLFLLSLGHSVLVYVNGRYIGTEHGVKREYTFPYQAAVNLYEGRNNISVLCSTVGMPDSGSYMERRFTGLRTMVIQGLGTGNLELTLNGWHHTLGLMGEKLKYYTEEGAKIAKWDKAKGVGEPLTWYKAYFDAPEGDAPLAVFMENMTKGMVWVNGNSIGRYWSTYLTVNKRSSQSQYHIPRAFIKPKDNMLVIFDEVGGNIDTVEVQTVHRDIICSYIKEDMTPQVDTWESANDGYGIAVANGRQPQPRAVLKCPKGTTAKHVDFASFGNPYGVCGYYLLGNCTASNSMQVIEKECLGKEGCEIPVDRSLFDKQCDKISAETPRTLAVQLTCGHKD